jgi:uncharacterized linocin/CFP29 family protein
MLLQDTEDLQVLSLHEFAHSLPGQFLKSGLRATALRTNSLLLRDEWAFYDNRVVQTASLVLCGIADLKALGLTISTGGLGAMMIYYTQESDISPASVNMSPDVDIEEDRLERAMVGLPVPIIAKAFRLNIRELAASRAHGGGLDTAHIDAATRKVAEMQEQILFNGSGIMVQGNRIYGYLTHPDRNTLSGSDWSAAGGSAIYGNVLAAISALNNDGYNGPYRLYLHNDQYNEMLQLIPNTTVPLIRTVDALPGMGQGSIKICGSMPAGQGVLVNMTSNVVDLAIGQDTIPVEWETRGGMVTRYLVFSCMVPRVKSAAATPAPKSGIAHISGI